MKRVFEKGFASIELVVAVVVIVALTIVGTSIFNSNNFGGGNVLATATTTFNSVQMANQDGDSFNSPGTRWIGTGQSTSSSYLGIRFSGPSIPQGTTINSAEIRLTAPEDYWLSLGFEVRGQLDQNPAEFSDSNKISGRSVTGASNSYSDNVKWNANETYSYGVTEVVQELVNNGSRDQIALIIKGTGGQWGRKFLNNSASLVITYETGGSTSTPISTTTPSPTSTSTPTVTSSPTIKPTPSPTPRPTITPIPTPTVTPKPTGAPSSTPTPSVVPTSIGGAGGPGTPSGDIYGAVPDALLGTCSHDVHDKYVTRGPNGQLYRTWHPPVDADTGCRFAHEHGDNPAASNIYKGPVPFSYVGSHIGIDMPHAGYKCFVHNKGTTNDEGGAMLHDSYYCFHMGTAGTGRYTAQFHELYFNMRSANGYEMNVQGLADTGGLAGTICDNPRAPRTVQGLGCVIDSAYEIWANDLVIRNRGNMVGFVQVSTAVFDPITTMDPSDRSRKLYTWDPEVLQSVFRFNNPRDHYRGCNREAYSGPVSWYNNGGTNVYYTDVYGNVENGGVLRQEISSINTNANSGLIDQFGGLIMAYKGGTEPQSQFKFRQDSCVPGLGLSN